MKLKILVLAMLTIFLTGCGENSNGNSKAQAQEKFPTFSTVNLDGETVTNEIFANKKITVINIWGTFCPPCIAEMPELGEWEKNISSDVQIVGLVCDVRGKDDTQTINAAKNILSDSHADFVNILPNDEIEQYLKNVEAVPTTIFIDSQGNIIGEPVIGADVESYKKRVEEYLKK